MYQTNRVQILQISWEGGASEEYWPHVLMSSPGDKSRDIKGELFKPLYLEKYVSDAVETLCVAWKGRVLDEARILQK